MPDLPSRFGPYEIVRQLGAGAMGQVYRARDSRLQRDVAIKVLLEASALNADRQRRFAQEAVAASALNHPNILTVYDVGVEGDIPYLVSELIDGSSLRVEMNRGRMPLKRVIEIAQQIAEGLAAAHDVGIVHRDLKPENVMVTRDGRAKIVDFGLAKAQDEEDPLLGAATLTQTAAGLIIGTVPYMSPEQARGGKADFRSDQFALGVMLYEMTTDAHPFRRDTAVQTLSAIIADEPPDPTQLNPMLPVAVRWLIRRLLAKDPRERYAHTADLAADLRNIRENVADATASGVSPVAAARWRWQPLVAAAIMTGCAFVLGRTLGPEQAGVRFERFTPFATDAGYQGSPAWSPDGKTLAYVAELNGVLQVFTRTIGSPMRTQVTTSAFDCHDTFWSPDGSRIYYHSLARDRDALWHVSPAGGAPEMMIEGATQSAISPNGQMLAVLREESTVTVSMSLWLSSPPGSEPKRLSRGVLADKTFSNGLLKFSPDGSRLLAWLWRDAAAVVGPNSGFWEIPLPEGEPRNVLRSLDGLRVPPLFSWLPDNRHIVLLRSDGPTPGTHLWVADTAEDVLRPLTATAGNEGAPAVSPDGRTVAFTSEATDFDIVEVALDGSALRPFLSSTRNEYDPAASPVSTQYAFVTDRTGTLQIWLQNEEGYLQQPLVTNADFGGEPSLALGSLAFSPDGKRLAFQRFASDAEVRFGGPRIWISSAAGGTPVPLIGGVGYQDAPTWSPDGEWIAYIAGRVGEWSLAKVRVGGRAEPQVLISGITPFVARPQWSPDGKWILCETPEGLMLVSSDGNGTRLLSASGWLAYGWVPDSRRIYGLRPTDDLRSFQLASIETATGTERIVNPNLGQIPQANQPIRGFSRVRDRGFLTSLARVRSDIYLIEGFRPAMTWWQRLWPFRSESER